MEAVRTEVIKFLSTLSPEEIQDLLDDVQTEKTETAEASVTELLDEACDILDPQDYSVSLNLTLNIDGSLGIDLETLELVSHHLDVMVHTTDGLQSGELPDWLQEHIHNWIEEAIHNMEDTGITRLEDAGSKLIDRAETFVEKVTEFENAIADNTYGDVDAFAGNSLGGNEWSSLLERIVAHVGEARKPNNNMGVAARPKKK